MIELIPSRDNNIRGAVIKIGKTGRCVNRPINKLYPIERSEVTSIQVDSEETNQRPKRMAAIIGEIKRKYQGGEC